MGLFALLALSCNATEETEPLSDTVADASSPEPLSRCQPAPGATGYPNTLYELVDLINGLPRPVTLACFLESLDRPLALNATSSVLSVQPALGGRSPRIFLLTDSLSLAVVPGAEALLEFAHFDLSAKQSVKGELLFPIEDALTLESAFERIALDEGTKCGACHDYEVPAPDYPFPGAYSSLVRRPQPPFDVDLAVLKQEHATCDAGLEPARCEIFSALFEHGAVEAIGFPEFAL